MNNHHNHCAEVLSTTNDTTTQQTERQGGGDGCDSEIEIDKAVDAMPAYISAATRRDRARDACKLASQLGGTGADIVAFFATLVASSGEKARPGRLVNMLRFGSSTDKRAYAAFLADKPRREMLRWLRTDPRGQETWAQAYGQEARRRFPTEQAAMEAYVNIQLGKQAEQARGGAA